MSFLKFENLNVSIKCGDLVAIVGPNACGKTNLLKKLCGKIQTDQITINSKNLNELSLDYKKNNIVCVFDDTLFNKTSVKEEMVFYLKKLNIEQDDINKRLAHFIKFFNLLEIVEYNFDVLNTEERVFIKILSLLIIEPSIVAIDDLFTYLKKDKIMMILNYIKEKNIILLSVISDMEQLIYFDNILVMDKGKKVTYEQKQVVLDNPIIFKNLGLSLPFIYDINNLLKDYDLINEDHIILRELVDVLWK